MNSRVISCPQCEVALTSPALFNTGQLTGCPACGALLRLELFPALFRAEARGRPAESILVEGESSCFYHAQKRAFNVCEVCGRFLCALCDVDLNGQHLCPVCLERGQEKRVLKDLENHRVRYDNLALLLSLGPLLIWPFTLLSAPAAIVFAIKHWDAPTSLIRPTRVRLICAVVLAGLEIVGWVIGLTYAFRH